MGLTHQINAHTQWLNFERTSNAKLNSHSRVDDFTQATSRFILLLFFEV